MNTLLEELNKIFNSISKKVYFVGGAVRDLLLHKEIKDIDLVTDARIKEFKHLFKNGDYSFENLGFAKISYNDKEYDISTLRKEIYQDSYRHPSQIIFVDSLQEDSLRRDFTINALYLDENNKIYDFHNGINDLYNKIIRMIGNHEIRIKEDPLRILRALRFCIQLDFSLDKELDSFIRTHLDLLNRVSRYQLYQEINKMKSINAEKFNLIVNDYHLDNYVIIDDFKKRKMNVIDLHCDTITELYKQKKSLLKNDLAIDIQKLINGQYLMQCMAIFLHQGKENIFEMYPKYLNYFQKEMAKNNQYLKQVYNYNDLMVAKSESKIGILLSIEEGEILNGNLALLDELYMQGVRMITLTWNYSNQIGHPHSKSDLGLTDFGKLLIKKMNELGMIIDVSHLSDQGFFDVLKLSSKPIVASHSNSRKVYNVSRNITDEMMLELHKNGGVVGINYYGGFLSDSKDQISSIVQHILHFKELGCLDNIALGSDFDGFDQFGELEDCSTIELLYQALKDYGLNENDIQKIFYKNFIRVMKNVLK